MSPVRYVRDGLKIVRVPLPPPPTPDVRDVLPFLPAPVPLGEEALEVADAADDYATRLHRWAAGVRRDAARYKPLREAEPRSSDVTREDLARARRLAGLTQKELALRLGFGRQHLSDMEQGRRGVSQSVGEWARRVLLERGDGRP